MSYAMNGPFIVESMALCRASTPIVLCDYAAAEVTTGLMLKAINSGCFTVPYLVGHAIALRAW